MWGKNAQGTTRNGVVSSWLPACGILLIALQSAQRILCPRIPHAPT
jgi:hypothetical protein